MELDELPTLFAPEWRVIGYFDILRTYLKKEIFGSDQGKAKHQTAGILVYFEDLMSGFNADMGQKDFFEIGSNNGAVAASNAGAHAVNINCLRVVIATTAALIWCHVLACTNPLSFPDF